MNKSYKLSVIFCLLILTFLSSCCKSTYSFKGSYFRNKNDVQDVVIIDKKKYRRYIIDSNNNDTLLSFENHYVTDNNSIHLKGFYQCFDTVDLIKSSNVENSLYTTGFYINKSIFGKITIEGAKGVIFEKNK